MRPGWKKMLLWSSFGSVALGAAVALVQKKKHNPPIVYSKIPPGCKKITLWTETLPATQEGVGSCPHDRYVLQLTAFKVWNILDLNTGNRGFPGEGAAIYHVTQWRSAGEKGGDKEEMLERFYSTVAAKDCSGKTSPKNHLARGTVLVLRKCLVGGASNGIESGEVHYSAAPILNYRFDYTAP